MSSFTKSIIASAVIIASLNANAGIVTNETELLGGADHELLSTMLGQDVDLTRIFSKQAGDTSHAWHAAVDNQGPTFTVFEVISAGQETMRVGGYNGTSWLNIGIYTYHADTFLFNLETGAQYLQNERNGNQYSTYNFSSYGPTFGAGHDLYLVSDLSRGYANIGHTFGDISKFGNTNYQNEFTGSYNSWTVGKMETFTLSASTGDFGTGAVSSIYTNGNAQAASNVSAPMALSALSLLGLMGLHRKKKTPLL